jgi:hypothetical protein
MTEKQIEALTEPLWMLAGIVAMHFNYDVLVVIISVRLILIAFLVHLASPFVRLWKAYTITNNTIICKHKEKV